MKGRLPDFLIIGGMKCGTTSLHDYLGFHPEIFVTKQKEIHYFADDKFYKYDLEWYKSHFMSDKKIAGTSPQNYTKKHNKYYTGIPERVREVLPNVKLIYILRDPLKRYQSHILENYYGEPEEDVKYNIATEHYLKTGLYHYQIEEWIKFYPKEQIHVLTLENLIANKLDELNRLFSFLDVAEISEEELNKYNFISNRYDDKLLPQTLASSTFFNLGNKISLGLLKRLVSAQPIQKHLLEKGKARLLPTDKLAQLKTTYREDANQMMKLFNLNLTNWSIWNAD